MTNGNDIKHVNNVNVQIWFHSYINFIIQQEFNIVTSIAKKSDSNFYQSSTSSNSDPVSFSMIFSSALSNASTKIFDSSIKGPKSV